jgi:hypothetical protein
VELEELRLAVYRRFAETGQEPTVDGLAESVQASVDDVRSGLAALHEARHLVLDGRGRIVMAHPFASIPLGFSVMGARTLWWGGCAWDSFAIPNLVRDEPEVLVATRCPACGTPHAWVVGRGGPPPGAQVAHLLTPADHIWDDVVRSCSNQRIFCDERCVDRWLAATGQARGYVMDLSTLWRLASHWYDGRLQPAYTRRDPATARAYFESVGLRGPFWGL